MSIHVWLGNFLFFALDASPCASTIKPFFRNLPEYHHKNITFWKPFEVHSLETPQQNRCWFIFGTYLFCPQSFHSFHSQLYPGMVNFHLHSPIHYPLIFYGFSWYVNIPFAPLDPIGLALGFPSQLQLMEPQDLCTGRTPWKGGYTCFSRRPVKNPGSLNYLKIYCIIASIMTIRIFCIST